MLFTRLPPPGEHGRGPGTVLSAPIGPALPPKSGLGEDNSEGTDYSDPQGCPAVLHSASCVPDLVWRRKNGPAYGQALGPVLCGLGLGGRNVLFLLSVME